MVVLAPHWALPVLAAILLLAACGGEAGDPAETRATVATAVRATVEALPESTGAESSTPADALPPAVLETSAQVRPDNPLIVEVKVSLDRDSQVFVEYENDDSGTFRSLTTATSASEHMVPIVRLRPSTNYDYEVFAVDSEERVSEGLNGSFRTDALPEALASVEFSATGEPTPELLLMDHQDVATSYILVLDADSNIVWYYASPNLVPSLLYSINAIRQKPDYNLVYYMGRNKRPCCLREITPLGEIVDSLSYSDVDGLPHHDHLILPDDEVLYLARIHEEVDDTAQGGGRNTLVEGDSIRIWDQKTGLTREIWNAFDAFDIKDRVTWEPVPFYGIPGQPERPGEMMRWWNANSLNIGPRGNYILSVKTLNQVVSISPDLEFVEWVFGGPNSGYKFLDQNDKFYLPHTVTELPNGNILVFDNGSGRLEEEGGEYSRVTEFALSDYDLSAFKVWEYRPEPDLFSRTRGGAYRLGNGNTLISFDTTPRVIVEVDSDSTEVWRLEVWGPSFKDSYRAYPFESIMGETRLR